MNCSKSLIGAFLTGMAAMLLSTPLGALELAPGVYREYAISLRENNNWRVTDPKAPHQGAQDFLPNPQFTLTDVDLEGARQAFLTMHHWAGHGSSVGQQVVVNGEHLLDVPINPNLPLESPEKYLNCDNPLLEVPLEWLRQGSNTFSGTFREDEQGKHWWGQWGWYWFKLYLRANEAAAPEGTLLVKTGGKVIREDTVELAFTPEAGAAVDEVRFFARYRGFDEDGDSIEYDWHGFEDTLETTLGNLGTDRTAPYSVTWNLEWIPDQEPGSVDFIAVVRSGNLVRVTEPLRGYSIERDYSVRLFNATTYPNKLIRNGHTDSATIPVSGIPPVGRASSALLVMRSWNGRNNEEGSTPLSINGRGFQENLILGENHYFGIDAVAIDPAWLIDGENRVELHSDTVHHGCEVLVPGPALLLRWDCSTAGDSSPAR